MKKKRLRAIEEEKLASLSYAYIKKMNGQVINFIPQDTFVNLPNGFRISMYNFKFYSASDQEYTGRLNAAISFTEEMVEPFDSTFWYRNWMGCLSVRFTDSMGVGFSRIENLPYIALAQNGKKFYFGSARPSKDGKVIQYPLLKSMNSLQQKRGFPELVGIDMNLLFFDTTKVKIHGKEIYFSVALGYEIQQKYDAQRYAQSLELTNDIIVHVNTRIPMNPGGEMKVFLCSNNLPYNFFVQGIYHGNNEFRFSGLFLLDNTTYRIVVVGLNGEKVYWGEVRKFRINANSQFTIELKPVPAKRVIKRLVRH